MAPAAHEAAFAGAAAPGRRLTAGGMVAILVLAYAAAVLLTGWVFIGDAPDYASDVATHFFRLDCNYLEFGHLAWRPVVFTALDRFAPPATGEGAGVIAARALALGNTIALACGLVAVLSVAGWLRNVVGSNGAALFGGLVLVADKALLNYAQVGTPYVPAFAFLCLGLYVASLDGARPAARVGLDVLAGVLYGASALLWGTFALALPGAVLSPLVWRGAAVRRQTFVRCVITGAAGVVTLAVVYAWVARTLGITSLDDFRAYVSGAGHGITTGGLPRAVIGLARSFVDMGDYGRVVKRFLVKDPYNPVGVGGLASMALFGLLAFYVVLGLAFLWLLRTPQGRRWAWTALLVTLPTILFAILWQGGDLERYLPAMPGLLLILSGAWAAASGYPVVRVLLSASLVATVAVNGRVMNNGAVRSVQVRSAARVAGVPDSVARRAIFVVPHWQDSLNTFVRNYPFHPRVAAGLTVYALLTPGTPTAARWRELAADKIQQAWTDGEHVLVSRRMLAPRPERDWDWVEGDDPNVSWKDLHDFFKPMDYRTPQGAPPEFLELPPTPANVSALARYSPPDSVLRTSVPAPASAPDDRGATMRASWPGWAAACRSRLP